MQGQVTKRRTAEGADDDAGTQKKILELGEHMTHSPPHALLKFCYTLHTL